MNESDSTRKTGWWPLLAAGVTLAAALAGREHVNPWLFGILLLVAWGLLANGLTAFRLATPFRILLTVTLLALAGVVWHYTAPQPRLQIEEIKIQKLPSTISPGVVEVIVRNNGALPADVVHTAAGQLATLFRTPRDLAAGNMEAEMSNQLAQAAPVPPTGTTALAPGQSTRGAIEIPPTQRSWFLQRREATMIVTARLRYRDRGLGREKMFCLFTTPPSGTWSECPFLNQ